MELRGDCVVMWVPLCAGGVIMGEKQQWHATCCMWGTLLNYLVDSGGYGGRYMLWEHFQRVGLWVQSRMSAEKMKLWGAFLIFRLTSAKSWDWWQYCGLKLCAVLVIHCRTHPRGGLEMRHCSAAGRTWGNDVVDLVFLKVGLCGDGCGWMLAYSSCSVAGC